MKGLRSYVMAFVSAICAPWIVTHIGIELDEEQKLYLVSIIMGAVSGAMRYITTGPDMIRQWVEARKVVFTPAQLRLIVALVRREVTEAKSSTGETK